MKNLERRAITDQIEIRAGDSGKSISGYAAVFDKPADVGYWTEDIAPTAFDQSLRENDVVALWSHNPDIPLGRMSNGSLSLSANSRGLRYDLALPDTQAGRDAFVSIERQDVKGNSFGFFVREDQWTYTEDKVFRRLLNVDLFEISPTAFPAYPQTSAWTRSILDRAVAQLREQGIPEDILEEIKHQAETKKPEPAAIVEPTPAPEETYESYFERERLKMMVR